MLTDRSRPSMQFFVTLIAVRRIEMTIGKLSTAIRMLLLFALAAMPDSSVSEAAKPKETATMTRRKSGISIIGFPRRRVNKSNPTRESTEQRMKL